MYTDFTDINEDANNSNLNNSNENDKIKKIAFIVLILSIILILIIIIVKMNIKTTKPENNNQNIVANVQPSIILSKGNLSLDVGKTFQLEFELISASEKKSIIEWESEDSEIASVSEDGLITANSVGETVITATYTENEKKYQDKCSVVVSSSEVAIESISIEQENITLKIGDKSLLKINVTPTDAKSDNIIYESDDSNIVSVNENGYIVGNEIGSTTVRVKDKAGTVSDEVLVEVISDGPTIIEPTSIKIIGMENGLKVGNSSKIMYNIIPNNATNQNVTWTSSDTNIATVENSVVKALKPGNCTIIATTENGLTDKIDITVETDKIDVSSIVIDGKTAITMKTGGTKKIKYKLNPENATNKKVKFSSSNTKIIRVDSNGIVAAIKKGIAVVTITTEDGAKTAIVNITVN